MPHAEPRSDDVVTTTSAAADGPPVADGGDGVATDVQVHLMYLKEDPLYHATKPVQNVPEWADKAGRTNVRLSSGPPETVHDVRGRLDDFTLDANGFRYVRAPTAFVQWDSQPAIAKHYLPEMESLLRRELDGCDEIIFYDARIRQKSDAGVRVQGLNYKPFARQVHTDNTETSVLTKIRDLTDMKADWHLSGRVRIINIWRPIKHPVYDCGLAIADGGKLRRGDVLECDRVRQDSGKFWDTMGVVRYRPGFEWYYMSRQDEPEVLLFKNYDSAADVDATCCLHTAFDFPPHTVPAGSPTRESIEVRAMVFTHPTGVPRPKGMPPTEHPIALALANENLSLVDEEHSLTDRLRTDIDEGHEVKDALLLLRRQEIRRLEAVQETLTKERDLLRRQLDTERWTSQQARRQLRQAEAALETRRLRKSDSAASKPSEPASSDANDSSDLDPSCKDTGGSTPPSPSQLMAHIAAQEDEIAEWKAQAMRAAAETVSRSWQAALDEALRREREKDKIVIETLREERDRYAAQIGKKS